MQDYDSPKGWDTVHPASEFFKQDWNEDRMEEIIRGGRISFVKVKMDSANKEWAVSIPNENTGICAHNVYILPRFLQYMMNSTMAKERRNQSEEVKERWNDFMKVIGEK